MKMSFVIIAIIVGVVTVFLFAQIYNRFLTTTVAGGIVNGVFVSCGPKPNCVSSMSIVDDESYVAPIRMNSALKQAEQENQWQALLDKISQLSRVRLISHEGKYAHFVFSSLVMGYPDDVELLWVSERGVIEVRSASRVGHSDLGVNRKRVEMIRTLVE